MRGKLSLVWSKFFLLFKRTDYTAWDVKPNLEMPIYGVYHVLCVNDWETLFKEQIKALKDSGLFEATERIYVSCIVSHAEDALKIKEYIGEKCSLIHVTFDKAVFEFPAIDFICRKAQQEDFVVYYFHTKGVSYQNCTSNSYPAKSILRLRKNVEAWRKMMEYFIFDKYNVATNVLKEYDTYGCYYKEVSNPSSLSSYKYYAGNFWWSKSEYIRKIPKLTSEQHKDRYWAENWLCQVKGKYFVAFNTSAELYATPMSYSFYKPHCNIDLYSILCFLYYHYRYLAHRMFQRIFR